MILQRLRIFSSKYVSFLCLLLVSCNGSPFSAPANHELLSSSLIKNLSSRTIGLVAFSDMQRPGALVADPLVVVEDFAKLAGVEELREILALSSILRPEGSLGANYSSGALSYAIVDGARTATLQFQSREQLSSDTVSTISSILRSKGFEIEIVTPSEMRPTRGESNMSIALSGGDTLSFKVTITGTWPGAAEQAILPAIQGLSAAGSGDITGLSIYNIGAIGDAISSQGHIPWKPASGSTISFASYRTAEGVESTAGQIDLPGLSVALSDCASKNKNRMILNLANFGESYQMRLSPLVACLLGAESPGFIDFAWRVDSGKESLEVLVPFPERVVSQTAPDTWPSALKPKTEYSKNCAAILIYTGETPDCISAENNSEISLRLPSGFIKRIIGGATSTNAAELYRLMLLHNRDFLSVDGRLESDRIIFTIQ